MNIVVVGGSGLIGDKLMTALHDAGHKPVAASPAFDIDAFTGAGLNEAMAGADVVVDVSNAPGWSDRKVLDFFTTVTRNALEAGRRAGVRHHVALSVLGCDRLPDSGYMRAKVAQEQLIRDSGVPFTILHSTQFMEFLVRIADAGTMDGTARVPLAEVQPIAAIDVARFMGAAATAPPLNAVREIAGPDRLPMNEAIALVLAAREDGRHVVADADARYFGTAVRDSSLLPGPAVEIAATSLATWLPTITRRSPPMQPLAGLARAPSGR